MEKETKQCPICGETIDSHAQVCPICGEPTGFHPASSVSPVQPAEENNTAVEEQQTAIPVMEEPIVTTAVEETQAVANTLATEQPAPTPATEEPIAAPIVEKVQAPVPPPIPDPATTPPPIPPVSAAPPPPPAPVLQEENKNSVWPWRLFMLLLGVGIGAGLYLLFFNDGKKESQESVPLVTTAEQSVVETLDSIQKALPIGAEMVLRVNGGDAPCLLYLSNGRLLRADALTKETTEVALTSINPEATIDLKEGGILKATPTPDDKDVLLLVASKGTDEKGLYKFNVESSRVDILGKGAIEMGGSGYIVQGAGYERHIDNTGNITRELDPGLPEELQTPKEETNKTPAKPKRQENITPQPSEPEPQQPNEPEQPVENNGTGFHLDPI